MKILTLLTGLIFSLAVSADPTPAFDLKMELSLNGKVVSAPRVVMKAGETASVIQNTDYGKTYVDVVASEASLKDHKAIMMKFTISVLGKYGKKRVIAKPHIIANAGEMAKISLSENEKGPEQLSLTVVAQRKSL